jgi:hypothetical protein
MKNCDNCGIEVQDTNNSLCNACGESMSVEWFEPSHIKFKNLMADLDMNYRDIADLLGMKYSSVKNQLAPAKELPKWAVSMLFVSEVSKLSKKVNQKIPGNQPGISS